MGCRGNGRGRLRRDTVENQDISSGAYHGLFRVFPLPAIYLFSDYYNESHLSCPVLNATADTDRGRRGFPECPGIRHSQAGMSGQLSLPLLRQGCSMNLKSVVPCQDIPEMYRVSIGWQMCRCLLSEGVSWQGPYYIYIP